VGGVLLWAFVGFSWGVFFFGKNNVLKLDAKVGWAVNIWVMFRQEGGKPGAPCFLLPRPEASTGGSGVVAVVWYWGGIIIVFEYFMILVYDGVWGREVVGSVEV
jgi:hypothetical protein